MGDCALCNDRAQRVDTPQEGWIHNIHLEDGYVSRGSGVFALGGVDSLLGGLDTCVNNNYSGTNQDTLEAERSILISKVS